MPRPIMHRPNPAEIEEARKAAAAALERLRDARKLPVYPFSSFEKS